MFSVEMAKFRHSALRLILMLGISPPSLAASSRHAANLCLRGAFPWAQRPQYCKQHTDWIIVNPSAWL